MNEQESPIGLPLPLTGATRLFAIVGDPIEQAGSPGLFNQAFRRQGVAAVLVPLQVPAPAIDAMLSTFRASGNWDGLVVTVPHKVAIAERMDELGPAARRMGAVNAVRKAPDGRLIGDNFDGEGFLRGLAEYRHDVKGRKILVLGAGGAGRAIAHALAEAGASMLTIVDLDKNRATDLAAAVQSEHRGLEVVASAVADVAGHDVVVNCTPQHGADLPVDLAPAEKNTLVVDIVLKPAWTPLLEEAARRGLPTHQGIHMLSGQVEAVLSFFGLMPSARRQTVSTAVR